MGNILLLFLVLFPMLLSAWVFPLRRRDRRYRNWLIQIIPAVELAAALLLLLWPGAALELPGVFGFGLRLQAGSLGSLLALVSAFLWAATGLNCPSYFAAAEGCNRFYFFWLLTLGALMGVFLAADLFTLFVFFEMMSFTSYVWVVQNETEEARQAGQTYLAVAVIGGMALLAGLLLLQQLLGTLEFSAMAEAVSALPAEKRGSLYVAGGCALVGFGAKAGMFPLHIWLPKAHPVAPAPASALLSGILTKSGVFGVLILCRYLFWTELPWNTVVLALGVVTMVLGAVLALFSVDLKRTLACSSMSQIGFILVGTAMQGFLNGENALAAWGTVLHMLNHSLIKLVLFVAAGVVYLGTHSLNLNDIRGWGRNKQVLKVLFFVGAASIAGVPGFSGYVSKTLLHESIVEYIHVLEHAGAAAGWVHDGGVAVSALRRTDSGVHDKAVRGDFCLQPCCWPTAGLEGLYVPGHPCGVECGRSPAAGAGPDSGTDHGASGPMGGAIPAGRSWSQRPLFCLGQPEGCMHLPSYWRSSLSPGGPRAADAAGGGWHGLSGPLAGPAGFGESGIPPAAVGPDLCGGPLRPGGRLRRRLAGAAGGADPLYQGPRHLCAEAGRELRHIRTETPPFPNGGDLLL